MAALLHPTGWREGVTLMLKAYIDASHKQPDIPVAAVAGFVATTKQWEKFEDLWNAFLHKVEIKGRFHAAEFWAKQGEFKSWPEWKFKYSLSEIPRIFNKSNLFGVACAIATDAFDEWRINNRNFYIDDPYYFCLSHILRPLIIGVSEHPIDEGVAIFIDRDDQRQKLGEQVATWLENRLRRAPKVGSINSTRNISTHHVSSYKYKPLQAADVLSNSVFQHCASILKTYGPLPMPPFWNKIDTTKCAINSEFLYDVELIELSMKGTYVKDYDL